MIEREIDAAKEFLIEPIPISWFSRAEDLEDERVPKTILVLALLIMMAGASAAGAGEPALDPLD